MAAGNSQPESGWRIDRAVSLAGSSRLCDLWLRDESVSKVHASLVLAPRGLWVVDLIGKGSMLVNGRPAYWKQLHDGSVLQIGRYRFRARFDEPVSVPAQRVGRHSTPEILPSGDFQPPQGGGLIDPTVAALLGQMAAMQSQFFEHSQNQMQFMGEILAQLGRSQQASVRNDVERIDAITRELEQLKSQFADQPENSPVRRPRKRRASPNKTGGHSTEAKTEARMPPSPVSEPAAPLPPAGGDHADQGGVSPAAAEAHKRLTERMARLAQERNAGWSRILDVFVRKPEGRAAD
jgi:hypothetical protein